MAEDFHELQNATAIGQGDLQIARAQYLATAINEHRDFTLISIFRSETEEIGVIEILVVELELDEVPTRNPYGIKYRERLALLVSSDTSLLVEVLALRKDFPKLMHLNQHVGEAPSNLCLYFDSPTEVFRTWTPQNFLKRIIWWLVASSRGELHPADQPIEQLFFYTKYELVLPSNIEEIKRNGAPLTVYRGESRPDGGLSCFLQPPQPGVSANQDVDFIDLALPPVLQGATESNPAKLGDLADLLASKGVDLIGQLKTEIEKCLPQSGVDKSSCSTRTIILLNIPIQRSVDAEPEGVYRRAFFILKGKFELGMELDICSINNSKYFYTPILGGATNSSWKAHSIFPMQVSRENNKAFALAQSGIEHEGPVAVLVGAGSLGSAMLNLWGRSGWGSWSVIDKDHIKPHNLSRHTALLCHIGVMKSYVVADLQNAAMGSANTFNPIPHDACDKDNQLVTSALKSAALIVDASTSLQYPRLSSTIHEAGRHASVFVTPNGNSAVLLIEDEKREIRLRSLEAQYYRAIIRQHWGENHLTGNRSFWSGASCRDISFVMPYTSVMLHASNLAEQVRGASQSSISAIRIWEHDKSTGAMRFFNIEVSPETSHEMGDYTVYCDRGVENTMRSIRAEQLPNETGGVLLGYYDLNLNTVVIVEALPPPPDSKATPTSFERGTEGLVEKINEASIRTAGVVGYVGEWHSHPDNYPATPSTEDLIQLSYLALSMADDGLPAIQVIVNDTEMSILQGEVR